MFNFSEAAIVIGAASGIVALAMHFRNLFLEAGVLKVSAFVGYVDGTHKQTENVVSVVLLNKGKTKIYIHKFGIREPKRKIKINGVKATVKGGIYHTMFNDFNTLTIEPNQKKVLHFDGYSEDGIENLLQLKKVKAFVVDSNGKKYESIIRRYGL